MNKNSALASLTATYTDSDNDEDHNNQNTSDASSIAVIRNQTPTPVTTPQKRKRKKRKLRRLVSYQDDTIISDDEGSFESECEDYFSSQEETSSINIIDSLEMEAQTAENNDKLESEKIMLEKYSHYKFKLPAKPIEKPSLVLIEKIMSLYEKMETKNMDMNKLIQERKEFRNPSIYEKLIEFCDIDEFGTNYPSDVYDPKKWKKSEMNSYLKLAEAQKLEMIKKQKDKKNVDIVKTSSGMSEDIVKKTKWDQKPEVKKPVTRLVTGNKGKKIPAMGPLK